MSTPESKGHSSPEATGDGKRPRDPRIKSIKGPLPIAQRQEYKAFRSSIPKRKYLHGQNEWSYYEVGPKDAIPVVCLHGTSGTAELFFYQLLALGYRGYRMVAAQFPPYYSHQDWVNGFHTFVKTGLQADRIHLFGVSLGGFLALHYTCAHPPVVLSLILSNAFSDTYPFAQSGNCISMLRWMPEFYLKKYILESFPEVTRHPEVVDFVVEQLETLNSADLASRLTLNCIKSKIGNMDQFDQSKLTLIDTVDDTALPSVMRQRLYAKFPNAKQALIKHGEDFPFLSNYEDVNLHLMVHLRGQGYRPDVKVGDEESKIPISGSQPDSKGNKNSTFLPPSSDGRISAADFAANNRPIEQPPPPDHPPKRRANTPTSTHADGAAVDSTAMNETGSSSSPGQPALPVDSAKTQKLLTSLTSEEKEGLFDDANKKSKTSLFEDDSDHGDGDTTSAVEENDNTSAVESETQPLIESKENPHEGKDNTQQESQDASENNFDEVKQEINVDEDSHNQDTQAVSDSKAPEVAVKDIAEQSQTIGPGQKQCSECQQIKSKKDDFSKAQGKKPDGRCRLCVGA